MLFNQLKTLLWRNAVLKKRGLISTLLEIIIPTVIILIIAYNSKYDENVKTISTLKDCKEYSLDDPLNMFYLHDDLSEIHSSESINIGIIFDVVFSKDFDKQTQDLFIENFKTNPFFKEFQFIDPKMNFTFMGQSTDEYQTDIIALDEDEYDMKFENKTLDINYEAKIQIFDKETDANKDLSKTFTENYFSSNLKMFGIIFKSRSSYTVRINPMMVDGQLQDNLKFPLEYVDSSRDYELSFVKDMYTIEHLVDNAIYKTLTKSNTNIQISEKKMDHIGYSTKVKVNILSSFIPFFMTFYFVPCICTLLNHLVIEKESRIKESLVIIGLRRSSFWISWAITYGIIIIIGTLIVTVSMYYFKFFTFIHWSVTVVTVLIYGLSCCCVSFILSTLIKRSKTANTIGVMIIIGFFVMYFISRYIEKKYVARWICSFIFSPVAFITLFQNLISLDSQMLNTTFLSIFSNHVLRNSFLALVFTFVLYFLIAIYLDNVLPQGNNLHRKWYFIFTDLFRHKHKKSDTTVYHNTDNPFIQEDPEGMKKAVEVRNIGKNFKVKRNNVEILKNINFNAYYDEIFAILGHNGAGKTTLMSIMTGILSSTRGEVYYDDVPITGNETDICRQFGYCPQFDTFNNDLTVGEHVRLFAGIKNIKVDVKEVLRDIDLLDKKDNFPRQLSGGQKRKLCITLALLGSPKYVFLDEPTTGLDPYSRKNIWELLSRKKKGCVTFVTTHYMDEADLLADRKMIISNGNITCLGTSLFLKNSFNMNYSLDVHTKQVEDTFAVDEIMQSYCPTALSSKTVSTTNIQVVDGKGNDTKEYITTYLLPMKYSKSFKNIFEQLNYLINDTTNGVVNFSLTAPTLEELFIRLESNDLRSNNNQNSKDVTHISVSSNEDLLEKLDPVFGKKQLNKSSSLRQIYAIIKLRLKVFVRNKTFAILYTLLPLLIIIGLIYLEHKIINMLFEPIQLDPMDISPKLYEDVQWFSDSSSSQAVTDLFNKIESQNKLKLQPVDYNNELTIQSGKIKDDMNYIGGFKGTGTTLDNEQFLIYGNATYTFSIPIAVNSLYNSILEQSNVKERISVTFRSFDYMPSSRYNENDDSEMFNILPETTKVVLEPILIVAMAMAISLSISIFGPLTVKEREDGIIHQLFLNRTKRINYWIGVLISDCICILVPVILIGVVGYIEEISVFHYKIIAYTILVTLVWCVASLLHQYIISFHFKKYEKASSLFVILNPILCLFIGIYAMIVALITGVAINNDEDDDIAKAVNKYQYYFYIILIFYAPVSIVLFYSKISTFVITKKINYQPEDTVSFMLSSKAQEIMKDTSLSSSKRTELLTKAFLESKMPNLNDLLHSKDSFVILFLIGVGLIVLYVLILALIEYLKSKKLRKNKDYTPEEREPLDQKLKEGPNDVYNEWKRVQQSLDGHHPNNDIALKVYELNKNYPISISEIRKRNAQNRRKNEQKEDPKGKKTKKQNEPQDEMPKNNRSAFQKMDDRIIYDKKTKKYTNRIVDDVTFGVNVGECLGLLGPNGAGKTTSISMITGLLSHTHGKIVYGNHDLNETDMADLSLGYCPQHNSLWKLLTVKETIQFYLNICGYPHSDIPRYTKALIEACGIENHTHKKISEISGGTRRKLSLIVAICSSPSYLILDEPSAGMDPFTRRYMWKLISDLKKVRETATILTTHSTEEAEALCERIAILIKGRLVCVDTPRSIKMNHSDRYTLEVFTDAPEQFEEQIVKNEQLFGPDVNYDVETSMNYQKYTMTMKTEYIARVFALMEQAHENGLVSQYNFGQYSLEQVFINFVNNVQ